MSRETRDLVEILIRILKFATSQLEMMLTRGNT